MAFVCFQPRLCGKCDAFLFERNIQSCSEAISSIDRHMNPRRRETYEMNVISYEQVDCEITGEEMLYVTNFFLVGEQTDKNTLTCRSMIATTCIGKFPLKIALYLLHSRSAQLIIIIATSHIQAPLYSWESSDLLIAEKRCPPNLYANDLKRIRR